jgi:hypothetical protein
MSPSAESPAPVAKGPAWREAEEFGLDMTFVEDALRRPVLERMERHQAALDQLLMLRKAFVEQYGGTATAS